MHAGHEAPPYPLPFDHRDADVHAQSGFAPSTTTGQADIALDGKRFIGAGFVGFAIGRTTFRDALTGWQARVAWNHAS